MRNLTSPHKKSLASKVQSHRRLFSLIAASLLLTSSAMFGLPIGSNAQDPGVTAQVNGFQFPVAVGDTIVQGELSFEGDKESCTLPEVLISVSGYGVGTSVNVETELTSDCREVVIAINKGSAANEPGGASDPKGIWDETTGGQDEGSSLAATRYRSGGWHDHKDIVGILLTETYADMYYYDNGGSVYGGHWPYTFCYNARDGWYGNWSGWNWGPWGPGSVWIWKMCNFSWIGGSYTHTLNVDVYSWPGNSYNVY